MSQSIDLSNTHFSDLQQNILKMPSRNLSFHQSDESSGIIITPRGLDTFNNNVFDKAFDGGLELDNWDDWMRWEGTTTDLLPVSIGKVENMDSGIASPGTWDIGLETSGFDMITTSYLAPTEFSIVEAPFEFEDTPQTSVSSISQQAVSTINPTNSQYSTQNQQQQLRRSYRGFSSLTEAEERNLENIAMPYHVLARGKFFAPVSPAESQASDSASPSPEPEVPTRKSNKRKSLDLGDSTSSTIGQSKKRGHNAIEKRYRTNLNAKIESLREVVPSLCGPTFNTAGEEELDAEGDSKAAQKYGKAAILMRALEYIQHLEKTTERFGCEVDTLTTRVGAFEKLAMCGSLDRKSVEVISRPTPRRRETLESIQSDFQQIQPKPKLISAPITRKRGSKQTKPRKRNIDHSNGDKKRENEQFETRKMQ